MKLFIMLLCLAMVQFTIAINHSTVADDVGPANIEKLNLPTGQIEKRVIARGKAKVKATKNTRSSRPKAVKATTGRARQEGQACLLGNGKGKLQRRCIKIGGGSNRDRASSSSGSRELQVAPRVRPRCEKIGNFRTGQYEVPARVPKNANLPQINCLQATTCNGRILEWYAGAANAFPPNAIDVCREHCTCD